MRAELPPREAAAVAPCRVLVVDDNPDIGDSVCELLTALGHDARLAPDGRTALAMAAGFVPDVVILDIGLPDLSGHEVAVELRRVAAGRPLLLVALTGWGQDEDRRRSAEAGIDIHLVKPVGLDILRGVVGEVPPSRRRIKKAPPS